MANLPRYRGAPTWVYVFGSIGIAVVLVFVITHLAGGGLGHHTH
jgi:ABC-type transporter Mla subunit MlaD